MSRGKCLEVEDLGKVLIKYVRYLVRQLLSVISWLVGPVGRQSVSSFAN